jgi:ribonuclease P protein component
MAIGALPNQLKTSRVGIRVQRGLRRAVDRNRIKRVFRAVYRHKRTRLQPGFDIVVVLYKDANEYQKVEQDFAKVCKRLRICSEDS